MTFVLARATKAVVLNAVPANVDQYSTDVLNYNKPFDVGGCLSLTVELVWAGLTGTIDGALLLNVSNDSINWTPKNEASISPVDSDGVDSISIPVRVSEQFYQIVFLAGDITGGTITCTVFGK